MQNPKVKMVVNGKVMKDGKGCYGCNVQLMHGWLGKTRADRLGSRRTIKSGDFEIGSKDVDVNSGFFYVVCNKVEAYAYERFNETPKTKEPVKFKAETIVLQDTAAASYTESTAIGALFAAYRYAAGVAFGGMALASASTLALTITKRVISRTRLSGTTAAQKREALLRIHTAVAKGKVKELPAISLYDPANFLKAVDSVVNPPLPKSKTNKKDGAEMILIPAGEFTMGDSDIEDNTPARSVTLSGYYIYKNLVTVAQYKKFISMTGLYDLPEPSANLAGNYPVVGVTWQEAMDYAKWAGADLPTEAEWEKAARGTGDPDKSKYPWGPVFDRAKLWSSKEKIGDAKGPTAVGRYAVSPYGCTDMAGNAMQWCKDHYRKDFWKGAGKDKPDPVNLEESPDGIRVARGGSWINVVMTDFRTATRFYLHPSSRAGGNGPLYKDTGFRCVQRKLL